MASPVDPTLDPLTSREALQSVMYLRAQAVLANPSALNTLQTTLQDGGQTLANVNQGLSSLASNFKSRLVTEAMRRKSSNLSFANVLVNATSDAEGGVSMLASSNSAGAKGGVNIVPFVGATEGENGVVPGHDGGSGSGSATICTINDQGISDSVVVCVIVIVAIIILCILGAIFG